MKKIICAVVIAGLLGSGCVFFQTAGTILGRAAEIICSPTVDAVAEAIQAINFINSNPAIKAAVGTAISVFLNIRDKVCVNIPQIQNALAALDAAVAQAQVRAVPTSKVPELKALRALVK
jgi:hypothetical protein